MFKKISENKVFRLFFPKKEKIIEEPGVLGHYETSKPFDQVKYSLVYAEEILIYNNEDILIYTREYNDTTFLNVLVYEEENFDISMFTYDKLKTLLEENKIKAQEKSVIIIIFQHKNDKTISACKKFCNSTKKNFEHALIYNPRLIQFDYYKPVPDFFKLYPIFCEDLYFDLSFIDPKRK